jgi:phosphoribosylanthranilate isomerase
MVRIKICGITNLEDALASVNAGADALGFNFCRQSPRYVEPSNARRIIESLPDAIMNVGVFVNETTETVEQFAHEAGLRAVQLHGEESPSYCRKLKNLFVIKAFRVKTPFEIEKVTQYATNAVLLDAFTTGSYGGSGTSFEWSVANGIRPLVAKLFLAGGLHAANVGEAIAQVGPYAVDVCSGVERVPGRKDLRKLRAFIDAARTRTSPSMKES